MIGTFSTDLPPGFRFHPTDEELIMFYLRNQATSRTCPVSIIPEVDIYKFDPWDLPEKAEFGESEWYFFSPRDRKYPNGARPNRAAVSGYWKATGTDKVIYSRSKFVGVKKALVFYRGKPPKGVKTDWIMHEYRLNESRPHPNKQNGSMRLDDWVLCRIYKKKNVTKVPEQRAEDHSLIQPVIGNEVTEQKFPRTCSLTHLWEYEYMSSISQLLDENAYNGPFINQEPMLENGAERYQQGQVHLPYMDPVKLEGNQSVFLNPVPQQFRSRLPLKLQIQRISSRPKRDFSLKLKASSAAMNLHFISFNSYFHFRSSIMLQSPSPAFDPQLRFPSTKPSCIDIIE